MCHQAAVVGAGINAADAPAYGSNNDYGTAVLLAQMYDAGCRRLVLASSMVVYGQGAYECRRHGPVDPLPRRRADLDAGVFEHRCPIGGEELQWCTVGKTRRYDRAVCTQRARPRRNTTRWLGPTRSAAPSSRCATTTCTAPHMPRDTPYSGVAAIFRSALENGTIPNIYEDGGQMRDFVHVDDVAAANVAAVESDIGGFGAFNVCSGHPIDIGDVAGLLCAARGAQPPVVTGQHRNGDVRHIVADPARAARELGFTASVHPREGLRDFAFAPLRA
ncbi:NAD dependent epimerase/dehydratase family protein [Mycobacterium kansasii 824]|nr:NAD dependent epimerase/dehydratase family protein [Mycobacterium kansasii 824]